MLELSKVRYYDHVLLVLSNFSASRHLLAVTAVMDCTNDIEIISKMYLVQFINLVKFLVAAHTVMSQKFGFACNNGVISVSMFSSVYYLLLHLSIRVFIGAHC